MKIIAINHVSTYDERYHVEMTKTELDYLHGYKLRRDQPIKCGDEFDVSAMYVEARDVLKAYESLKTHFAEVETKIKLLLEAMHKKNDGLKQRTEGNEQSSSSG